MNTKRLVLAIPVVFAALFALDFLTHGVWLQNDYKQTMQLWRPEAEMRSYMPWIMLGQLFQATVFCVIYAKGFASMNCLRCACMVGLMMGLFSEANTLIGYAVTPMPGMLAVKWFGAGLVRGVVMGILAYVIYKPAASSDSNNPTGAPIRQPETTAAR